MVFYYTQYVIDF